MTDRSTENGYNNIRHIPALPTPDAPIPTAPPVAPTNPAAVFTSQISPVPGTNQVTLVYSPAVSGRAYNYQSSTNLVPGAYTSLSTPTVQTNGNQITVTDRNANGPRLFYRVGVSIP